jgi:hypothetical protein
MEMNTNTEILNAICGLLEQTRTRNKYMDSKPTWEDIEKEHGKNHKYLCYSQYLGWYLWSKKDPWYSTNFVEYVEDRNGNQVKPN